MASVAASRIVEKHPSRFRLEAAAGALAEAQEQGSPYVAAVLGVADELADGPRTVGALVADTGTNERATYRRLRALAVLPRRDGFSGDVNAAGQQCSYGTA